MLTAHAQGDLGRAMQLQRKRPGGMKIIEQRQAPNPRRVRIFLAEKGVVVPFEQIDIMKQEHRLPEFADKNPMRQVPVLPRRRDRDLGERRHLPLLRGD